MIIARAPSEPADLLQDRRGNLDRDLFARLTKICGIEFDWQRNEPQRKESARRAFSKNKVIGCGPSSMFPMRLEHFMTLISTTNFSLSEETRVTDGWVVAIVLLDRCSRSKRKARRLLVARREEACNGRGACVTILNKYARMT